METLKLSDRELRLGFTFDHDKCIVCGACVDACNRAYGGNWRVLPVFELEGGKTALSMSCNHCDNPVCMKSCPAVAISKNEMGIVTIDSNKCIGCGYCQWACPYEALHFSKDGTMGKCHLCVDRLGKGMPYCVESCPTGALTFGWLDRPDGEVNYLAPASITRPRLKIVNPKEIKASPLKEKREENATGLIAFTLGSEIALVYSLLRLPYFALIAFVLLAGTLLLSVGHAKVNVRSMRVILNLSTSWLSREVLFGGLSALAFLLSMFIGNAYYVALPLLVLSVISSIMIYMLKSRPSWYHPDTPMSFLGAGFTVVSPLAYVFIHSPALLVLGAVFAVGEIITARSKAKMGFKDRRILNLPYLVLEIATFFVPLAGVVTAVVSILSEIIHRREFFQKVVYYGVPTV
ncbi:MULTISPECIES: 4Fe-4S dicluster domain-containing protein [Metallosphaera]|uniref:4Fe-4S ferredoxin, iron-sulfur binding domain protein n=4 Tax=Metallosphaera TaxID=41980 RepID=A4YDI0_METS5|nr:MULTISPECIES: 4Fe-4S dicluster domain-containing protein [Metallosphaera]ABP94482.1 4Fe-4S ferredoxin, iron-sulfur binding domain protein [Metallosphaera sedula DSM 5348]AIM26469.1 4Fe-4S ferredoxin, iron-sulfur binding domain protein [Metallosphaera sedula]MCY0862124.1 4Fe-4S binding protein [Metallosphaera prunae]QCO29949.1 4Fe-4S dicluster domain-containing protein [Metallosphaera prunae]WPX06528.1 4Fe-4S dicluster domain-containing protein [Metallosphaera sedula DSM 5348]